MLVTAQGPRPGEGSTSRRRSLNPIEGDYERECARGFDPSRGSSKCAPFIRNGPNTASLRKEAQSSSNVRKSISSLTSSGRPTTQACAPSHDPAGPPVHRH
jgi:hypothetical protein